MNTIVCPYCQKQYQVQGDPSGKNVKCSQCQKTFVAKLQPAAQPVAATSEQPSSQSGLFPATIPAGPDPLANHVVADPGFVDVDVAQIREDRENQERKNSKYEADDPLAKFKREQREKRKADQLSEENTQAGLRAGLVSACVYAFLVVLFGVLAIFFEWGFYALLGTFGIGALALFLTDILLLQYIKQKDGDRLVKYIFIPPYRIMYWVSNWSMMKGFALIEIVVGIPFVINGILLWYFDGHYSLGWFG